ncbi:DUF4389 domain-containing protein [Sulfurovum sp. zt1-1]|uniref:DUF4389 domain-containing protein n=1 Tax=Sulfurovum zhangzhouensis TaxID=3019067 RepID=A0ABT7QUR3_9BACT|nr:DUF4389 domain-containing protein [Sulfurovum zhangzhouensis]MDM5270574.1 DUF4389 domain-containing protein [Sulfurovum zhangzhouensis]
MEEAKNNAKKASGERLLYTIFYVVIANIVWGIVCVVVIAQFLYSWIGNSLNDKLLSFSASLSEYAKELIAYISFNSDEKPWPMGDWPHQNL